MSDVSLYDQFWADFLGVQPSDWHLPGISLRSHVGLIGYRGMWCFRRMDRTVVSVPADWIERLRPRVESCDPDSLFDEDFLRAVTGTSFERLIGPAFQGCLPPARFRAAALNPAVRNVKPGDDQQAIDQFRAECSHEWDQSGLDKVKQYLCACFSGKRITAMAGYRLWTDTAGDPCVLTHPEFYGKGYGTAVVSAVVDQALQDGKLLLYQTLIANHGAVRIALKLGYEQYASHVAVRLKDDVAPPEYNLD